LLATTNRWRRPRKSARWKKFPPKVKVKGSTGNPAGPTVAPGGSEALGLWLLVLEDDLPEVEEDPVGVGVELGALAVPALKVRP
jgi:hypothetical protein